jgi:hypothetical protein
MGKPRETNLMGFIPLFFFETAAVQQTLFAPFFRQASALSKMLSP